MGRTGNFGRLTLEGLFTLNEEQRTSVHKALSAKDYSLVRGMPGAGKTQTAAFLVRALIAGGSRVLVASHAHAAVDHLLEKVLESGVSRRCVVRVASSSSSRRVAIIARPGGTWRHRGIYKSATRCGASRGRHVFMLREGRRVTGCSPVRRRIGG